MPGDTAFPPDRPSRKRFWLALAAAIFVALGLAESYLRLFPPKDLHLYLGNASPLRGGLACDTELGTRFKSLEALIDENPRSLSANSPLLPGAAPPESSARPWLVVGNSFGFNLSAALAQAHPERQVRTFDTREILTVRIAQIKTLLEAGGRPEHVFLVITPVDFKHLGEHSLARHTANARGGLAFKPRLPGGLPGEAIGHCRLLFTAWVRLGLHLEHPKFRTRQLAQRVPDELRRDIDQLFAVLGRLPRQCGVPITIVLIPMRREVLAGSGFAIDETLAELCREHDLDCFDPRPAFLAHRHPVDLFVADGHLSEAGNALAVQELTRHLEAPRSALDLPK